MPFGRGRAFGSNANRWLDTAIGGWNVSGLPTYQSGLAFSPASGAVLAGISTSDPAILAYADRGAVAAHLHKDSSTGQLQLFRDGLNTSNYFRGPVGLEYGQRNSLRGPSQFTFDAGLSKNFVVLPNDRLNLLFRADFYNILNHPIFSTPSASLSATSTFGAITSAAAQYQYRVGQFSLRLEF